MIANAARHGTYGINGQYFPTATPSSTAYYPAAVFDGTISRAGPPRGCPPAPSSRYFQDQFVNIAAGDYTVRADSLLNGAAPDGSDVGAIIRADGEPRGCEGGPPAD